MPSLIPEDLARPGTHALVIGVSAYRHLADGTDPTPNGIESGMEQLSAAARSASEFAGWLARDYRGPGTRLSSLRVLLSPAPGETIDPGIAALLDGDFAATRPNVEAALVEFRAACDRHIDNVVIVYVVGHGVQLTKHGAIVLLHDFGAPTHVTKLQGAIDMAGVHAGMNHPGTAKTQFWYVDACRQQPLVARRFELLTGALSLDVPNGSTETSPLFLAATTGKDAFARVGGVTLFNEALMWSLRGGVANGPEDDGIEHWHVPVTELVKRLPDRVRALAEGEGAEQSVDVTGKLHEAVFHVFDRAPKVELTIDVSPANAKASCKGTLKLNADQVVAENFASWPFQESVDAGLYLLNVQAGPPFANKDRILRVEPPRKVAAVDVG